MPSGKSRLPGNKKEERGHLNRVVFLAPLLSLILQLLELALKLLRVIK